MKGYTILLLLFLCPCFVSAQDLVVKGIVLDKNNGEPLIGATVLVKGTTIGVVTDLDGNFSLKVPAKDVQLSISYIGFEAQTVTPVFGKKMKIELGTDAAVALDEVVVVAFGTQKKGINGRFHFNCKKQNADYGPGVQPDPIFSR